MFIIALVFALIVFSLIGFFLYLFYLPINKWLLKKGKITIQKSNQINKIFAFVLFFIALGFTYNAFYPNESFYVDEFKEVTNLEIPKSYNFIEKTASYPDFHGDYISCSEIKLSNDDFKNLLSSVKKEVYLTSANTNEISNSEESLAVISYKEQSQIMYGFKKVTTDYTTYYIGFKNDNQTIFVYVHT